jgi:thiol-disulfide isomerase/thioredoxin
MKKLIFCVLGMGIAYHAQAQMSTDGLKAELDSLMATKDPSIYSRLQVLAASDVETEMSIAASYYFQLKNAKAFDSVSNAELIKFPKGLLARIKAQQVITAMKSLPEIEEAYLKYIKNYPSGSYPGLPFGEDRLTYDRILLALASGYAHERNVEKANYYAGLLTADFWKVHSYSVISDTFYANGDMTNAVLYQKKAVESAAPYFYGEKDSSGTNAAARYAINAYPEACGSYAKLLYEQQKYEDALHYISMAAKGTTFNYLYAEILVALNRNTEAYNKIESVVRSGEANNDMVTLFKTLYVKVLGDTTGLGAYEADIHKGVIDNMRKRLLKNKMNVAAADFTLTDIQGRQVHLASLKGKIVILDFWATWCVPCKASFPAMQMAVDKYKSDSSIQFLFIHTLERSATPLADVQAYISGMKYNFEVLMDLKDPETKDNNVVASYNVSSIPTKFVIDKRGTVRFKLVGFDGSNDEVLDELKMMIDMLKKEG